MYRLLLGLTSALVFSACLGTTHGAHLAPRPAAAGDLSRRNPTPITTAATAAVITPNRPPPPPPPGLQGRGLGKTFKQGLAKLGICPPKPLISRLPMLDAVNIKKIGVAGNCKYIVTERWDRFGREDSTRPDYHVFTEGYGLSGMQRMPVDVLWIKGNDMDTVVVINADNAADRTSPRLKMRQIIVDLYTWQVKDIERLAVIEFDHPTNVETLQAARKAWDRRQWRSEAGRMQVATLEMLPGDLDFEMFKSSPLYMMAVKLCREFIPTKTVVKMDYAVGFYGIHRLWIYLGPVRRALPAIGS